MGSGMESLLGDLGLGSLMVAFAWMEQGGTG